MSKNQNLTCYSLLQSHYCKIHGRTDESQYPLPLFWNGSGIETAVTGTELWIDIEVNYERYEPWVSCFLNGSFISRQLLTPGRYSLCLFRGLNPDTVKNLQFIRELQPMSDDPASRLLIHGFQSDGIFVPVAEKRYKLEFVGDSLTSGEGTYGALSEEDWVPAFMSASRNYAAMVSDAIHAEYRLISQGGWGVLCGWDHNAQHNIPSCYEQICSPLQGMENAALGADKPYNFSSWQPDAVIINLGTNDGGAFQLHLHTDGSFRQEDIESFINAAVSFLITVRKNNPDSHIIWAYGMVDYTMTLPITEAINKYRKQTGDPKVSFLQLPALTDETLGSRFHPGAASHERAARLLTEYLKTLLEA